MPHVSTFEFHEHRERAPHLEQAVHLGRLMTAYNYSQGACVYLRNRLGDTEKIVKIIDLGCGDGGLLSLMKADDTVVGGFDFQPSNIVGWAERGVNAWAKNFVDEWDDVDEADIYTITECLEHLADPHDMVRRVNARGAQIVASSPWTEHAGSHDECHAWAWDHDGYAKLITDAGFDVAAHEHVGMFQVIWGIPRD